MSPKYELNSRHRLFLLKVLACLAGLLGGSFLLAPQARMQDEPKVITSNRMMINSNYQATPEPLRSTVRGRVFYEDTGRAVKRTSLLLMVMGENGGREVSGLTDNNGVFEIKNVPAGTYYAYVNAPGIVSPLAYADFSKLNDEGLTKGVEGFPAIVVGGGVDVDVQIPARRGGAVSGRIMYADGDPAIGVKVEILRKVEDKFVPVIPNFANIFSMMGGGGFQTDDRGMFRFSGLPGGEYIVKITENVAHDDGKPGGYRSFEDTVFGGSSLLTLFYPDALETAKAQPITIVVGQETPEISMFIPERALFNAGGRIINGKDKSPVKNATVTFVKTGNDSLSLFDNFGRRQLSVTSDARGNWKIKELPKGIYTLTIEPGHSSYEDGGQMGNMNSMSMNTMRNSNWQANGAPPKPRLTKKTQEITVDDRDLSEIVVELGYGATVSGTVKTENNQPMPPSITVTALQENSEEGSSASIDNYGAGYAANSANFANAAPRAIPEHDFKMEGVATGKTFFWAHSSVEDFYVKSAIYNGIDLLTVPLDLKEGEVVRNVQFVVSKNVGTLKGIVKNQDKQFAPGVWILLVPVEASKRKNPNLRRGAVTGENGEFEIKAAPNEYAIVFSRKEFFEKKGEESDRLFEEAVKTAVKVTLKPNETEQVALVSPK